MPISVTCAECKKALKVADTMAGKAFKCPGCKSVVKVPAASAPAPAPARKSQPARVEPEDDEPPRRSTPQRLAENDEPRPSRKSRRDEDEDDYDDRPTKKSRRNDYKDDEEDDRPRKRKAPTERLEEVDEDLPVEELDLEQADLPDNIRERIEGELSKGEKLYWVGMPSRRIVLIRSIWAPIVGMLIFLFVFGFFVLPSLFMSSQGVAAGLGMVIIAGGFALVVGGSFCIAPLYNLWRAGRTCYALTSRRAIVWQAGIFGGVEMENYNPARLANMWRRDMWIFGKGGGDLVFRSVTIVTVTTGRHGGVSQNTTYYGFIAVENVRKVERLVREVLVDKVIDRLTS